MKNHRSKHELLFRFVVIASAKGEWFGQTRYIKCSITAKKRKINQNKNNEKQIGKEGKLSRV